MDEDLDSRIMSAVAGMAEPVDLLATCLRSGILRPQTVAEVLSKQGIPSVLPASDELQSSDRVEADVEPAPWEGSSGEEEDHEHQTEGVTT